MKEWALKLDVPILSVDFSLAPEAPYPRAIEEIFYGYCWALKNPELVGWTGEHIVFKGDSSGANLAAAVIIKCIEMGVPTPQGLFSAYGIFVVNLMSSPSRFMHLYDPILSLRTVVKVMKGYGVGKPLSDPKFSKEIREILQNSKIKEQSDEEALIFEIPRDYLLSPYWAPDEILQQFPPTTLLTMVTDPGIDDNVDFARKLRGLKVDVQLDILDKLPHGFLFMVMVGNFYVLI